MSHWQRFKLMAAGVMSWLSASAVDSLPADTLPTDTLLSDTAVVADNALPWYKQLIQNGFHINDPSIRYPKFARFCVDVYNWGDRTFNSYDPEYVEGTGKNWKLYAHNDVWMQSYALVFKDLEYVRISSTPYDDLGANLSFMAVSLGYTVNARTLFTHTEENRNRFNFNFVCALFSASLASSSIDGGARISHFGNYEPVRHRSYDFDDINSSTFNVTAYYYFNHRRYSHAAAYCYSKYQLRSAGSWIAGITYGNQNVDIDFSNLPEHMLQHLPVEKKSYRFHDWNLNLAGGYGYSWALKPRKWLLNVEIIPSLGLRHSYEDATDGRKVMLAGNMRGMFSLVFNHRALYASLYGNVMANFYFGKDFTFVNASELLYVTTGIRF